MKNNSQPLSREKKTDNQKQVVLKNNQVAFLRPIGPEDRPLLEEAWHRLSQETIRKRFLAAKKGFSAVELDGLTQIDHENHCAFGVSITHGDGTREGIGVARFVREKNSPDTAEFAIVIVDHYQGQGVGTLLLTELLHEARKKGIRQLIGKIDVGNLAIKKLLKKWPYFSFSQDSPGVLQVRAALF